MIDKRHRYPCRVLLLVCCLPLGACTTLGYYGHTVAGHLEVLQSRRPVQEILADDQAPDELKNKLRFILVVLDFAHKDLQLPDNGSYRHYADLERPFVVWNVFAAPKLSLQARQWCYHFIGCFHYRGYFEPRRAGALGAELERQGLDVYIGGVRAYSTLGWFRDPILNTMLKQPDWQIARLIFHELAHQKIYLKNRNDLNEAFAESVARIGLDLWLQRHSPESAGRIRRALAREDAFFDLVLEYRGSLKKIYHSDLPKPDKRRQKQQLLTELKREYQHLKRRGEVDNRYEQWLSDDLNNAKLVAVSTYRRSMSDFMALFAATGSDLGRFFDYVDGLRHCKDAELQQRLSEYIPKKTC